MDETFGEILFVGGGLGALAERGPTEDHVAAPQRMRVTLIAQVHYIRLFSEGATNAVLDLRNALPYRELQNTGCAIVRGRDDL
jgi:hypothetical protein